MDTIAIIIAAISIVIAGYGAVLSTIVLIRRIEDNKVDIFVSYGYSYKVKTSLNGNNPDALIISAVNQGKRDSKLRMLGIEIPDYCIVAPGFIDAMIGTSSEYNKDVDGRIVLKSGDEIEVSFDYKQLTGFLVKKFGRGPPCRIRPVYEDTLNNYFPGTWFKLGKEDC